MGKERKVGKSMFFNVFSIHHSVSSTEFYLLTRQCYLIILNSHLNVKSFKTELEDADLGSDYKLCFNLSVKTFEIFFSGYKHNS